MDYNVFAEKLQQLNKMKKLIIYALLTFLFICVGNIWCYLENERLLNSMTNVCFVIAGSNFLIPKYFSIKRKSCK